MLSFVFGPVQPQRGASARAGTRRRLSGLRARGRQLVPFGRPQRPARQRAGPEDDLSLDHARRQEVEFSEGFTDLHTRSYEEIVAGRGFRLEAVRPSIEIVSSFRALPVTGSGERHPFVARYAKA